MFGSSVGGSAPRSILRICSSARLAWLAAAEADAAGAADVPGAVDAGGADEELAPPHAATMTATLAKMPNSRFCMDTPPNGFLTRRLRYRGPPALRGSLV